MAVSVITSGLDYRQQQGGHGGVGVSAGPGLFRVRAEEALGEA